MKQSSNGPRKGQAPTEILSDSQNTALKVKKWFPDLSVETVHNLSHFQTDLLKVNRVLNLVATANLKNADALVLADAILAARLVAKSLNAGQSVYEFGSGSGIPGMVLSILHPDLKVVILERDSKKLEFIKHIASSLKLSNLAFVAKGLDDFPAHSIYNLIAKGFSPLSKALLATRKNVVVGGKFFHLKTDSWATELSAVPSQLFSIWEPSLLGQYRAPESSTDMAVVLTVKIGEG